MKNILTKLANLWNRFTRESEEWEYFEYLQRNPDQAPFLENKTKAELAKELHDWKMRSNEQAQTIIKLREEYSSYTESVKKHYLDAEIAMTEYYRNKIQTHYKQVI